MNYADYLKKAYGDKAKDVLPKRINNLELMAQAARVPGEVPPTWPLRKNHVQPQMETKLHRNS